MTNEEYVGYTYEQWEKLSDVELEKMLAPFFNVTRPIPGVAKQRGALVVSGRKKESDSMTAKKLVDEIRRLAGGGK